MRAWTSRYSAFVQISHSAEIAGNQNDEIGADVPGQPTDIDDYDWTTGGRVGPVLIADPGM